MTSSNMEITYTSATESTADSVSSAKSQATRFIELKIPVYTTGTLSQDKDSKTHIMASFTDDQWTYIEKCALEFVRDRLQIDIEELITPEVDWEPNEGTFPDTEEDGITDEEYNQRGDFNLEGAGTVIDVLESFLAEVEEGIGKRDI